jgi:cytochrome c-type biogenesis protein CcmE
MRLIGVTAIILVAVAAIVTSIGSKDGALGSTVAAVAADKGLVGKRVKVSGAVVAGSWDKKSSPMRFAIKDESDKSANGPTIKVVYNGSVPSTFGDGVVAVVTGELKPGGTIESTDMITKCPSKYSSAQGALTVKSLAAKGTAVEGKTVKVTGYLVADPAALGAGDRFALSDLADGSGATLPVQFEGALPATIKKGIKVVVTGSPESGKLVASEVALDAATNKK